MTYTIEVDGVASVLTLQAQQVNAALGRGRRAPLSSVRKKAGLFYFCLFSAFANLGIAQAGAAAPLSPIPGVKIIAEPVDLSKSSSSSLVLRYGRPANDWMTEALPVGNGHLGAMVFGGINWERIQFNEKSLWNGDERKSAAYQAFGDLFLKFDGAAGEPGEVSGYSRTLNLDRAIQTTTFVRGGVRFTREVIASYPANVIVVRMTADQPKAFSGSLWLADMHGGDVIAGKDRLTCTGVLNNGLDYESQVRVITDGGSVTPVLENGYDNKPVPRIKPGAAVLDGKADAYLSTANARRDPYPYFDFNDTNEGGKPIVLDGAWFDRGLSLNAPLADMIFDLGGKYRWVSFTTSLAKGASVQVYGDGKLIGETSAPGGYVCFPLNSAKELKISSKTRYIPLGHLRVSASETEPTRDPGIVRPVSSEKPPGPAQAGTSASWFGVGAADLLPPASLRFKDCNAITLVLGAKTAYLPDRSKGWRGPHPHEALTRTVDAAAARPYAELLAEHEQEQSRLFGSLSLNLGAIPPEVLALSTDKRLERYGRGEADPGLEVLAFQFGRYLLTASSRPGTLPANLQGIWNQVNNPPWTCDYHADVNVEMNYWPADVANLSECFLPLSDWMLASLPVWTEATAAAFKGSPGWTVRGHNGIYGGFGSMWYYACNAWLCRNLWDHYAFTQDKEFLKRVYPLLRGAAEYWETQLIEEPDGTLLTRVTSSPEHGPQETGVSFSQQLVWDLYGNTAEATRILGTDREFGERLDARRAKLLGPKIGRWGQLQEWKGDIDDPKCTHRHTSHLVAVYPGVHISLEKTPELAKAAATSLIARGEESTGWALAWRINIWARLREPERAYGYIRRLLRPVSTDKIQGDFGGGMYGNLLDCCPPFMIDGNFGFTAGVAELLVQSHEENPESGIQDPESRIKGAAFINHNSSFIISLLPALPKAWPTGSVKGLLARGGFTVDIEWRDGTITSYRVSSKEPRQVSVRVNGKLETIISEREHS